MCAGCASPTARQVAALPDYHATQDYNLMNSVFESVHAIATRNLRVGMSPADARRVMGAPKLERADARRGLGNPELDQAEGPSRVQIWTYLRSISGTWEYNLVFLDGRLEFFGELNPQWLDMESYTRDFPQIKRVHDAIVGEKNAEHAGGG